MSKDVEESGTEVAAGCLISLLSTPLMVALRGFVLSKLWGWLMVPIFGIRGLSIWQALAVSVVIGTFTFQVPPKSAKESTMEMAMRHLICGVLGYGIALAFGYMISGHV